MKAAELARVLNARRVGKGKWTARCPAHSDRHPSLSIAEGSRVPVLLKCQSAGCDTKAILEAAGLRWADLFDGKPTREFRQRLSLEEQKAALERQLGLAMWLGSIERGKRAYWAAAERRIRGEIDQIRCWLEPGKVIQEWRERVFRGRLRKFGWEKLWEEIYGVDRAGAGIAATERKIRPDSVHGGPRDLLPSGLPHRTQEIVLRWEHVARGR